MTGEDILTTSGFLPGLLVLSFDKEGGEPRSLPNVFGRGLEAVTGK
jgi:hypothetical protein